LERDPVAGGRGPRGTFARAAGRGVVGGGGSGVKGGGQRRKKKEKKKNSVASPALLMGKKVGEWGIGRKEGGPGDGKFRQANGPRCARVFPAWESAEGGTNVKRCRSGGQAFLGTGHLRGIRRQIFSFIPGPVTSMKGVSGEFALLKPPFLPGGKRAAAIAGTGDLILGERPRSPCYSENLFAHPKSARSKRRIGIDLRHPTKFDSVTAGKCGGGWGNGGGPVLALRHLWDGPPTALPVGGSFPNLTAVVERGRSFVRSPAGAFI